MQQLRATLGVARDLFRSEQAFRTGAIILIVLLGLGALSFFAPYGPTDRRVVPIDRAPRQRCRPLRLSRLRTSSRRIPSKRRLIISAEVTTEATARMWIVCTAGMIQSIV